MFEIKKDEIPFDYEVKDRLEFICKYANRDARFFNGYVVSINRTNLRYVEPHKLVIGNHLFLFFNFKKELYYQTLTRNKIELKDFNSFIHNLD